MSKFGSNDSDDTPTRILRSDRTRRVDRLTDNFSASAASSFASDEPTERLINEDPTGRLFSDPPTELLSGEDPAEPLYAHGSTEQAKPGGKVGSSFREVEGSPVPGVERPEFHAGIDTGGRVDDQPKQDRTVVFRPKVKDQSTSKLASDAPVIAWFVVVKGPGRGSAVEFSYGLQSIGRDSSQGIALNFGDSAISRENHAAVEYDPKTRHFYLSKGGNLVYLNGGRVGQGQECKLQPGDELELGDTVLKFIPFCGPDFCWNDHD